jgi:hypothetical protein
MYPKLHCDIFKTATGTLVARDQAHKAPPREGAAVVFNPPCSLISFGLTSLYMIVIYNMLDLSQIEGLNGTKAIAAKASKSMT